MFSQHAEIDPFSILVHKIKYTLCLTLVNTVQVQHQNMFWENIQPPQLPFQLAYEKKPSY